MKGYRISRQIILIMVSLLICSAGMAFGATLGDVNSSGGIDLGDAILALQISAGMTPAANLSADVDGNSRIGLAEAIFALRSVSTGGSQNLQRFGDTGIPADYDQSLSDLSQFIENLDAFADELPPVFDWRDQGKVTPVKDQGSCGSCWAFASAGALESKILIEREETYDLSEQQQVSCNSAMYGCSGGNSNALKYWAGAGPMAETCAPYTGAESSCSDYNSCTALPYFITDYYTVDTDSLNKMKSSLVKHGPAYFRYDVYTDFLNFWSTSPPGSIYRNTGGTFTGKGHAVLLIGWNDNKGAWLCKNSWGETNGPDQNGTFWIAYGDNGHTNSLHFGMANFRLAPDFMLSAPNGGESWQVGQNYVIRWEKGNVGSVDIELYRGQSRVMTIIESAENSGLYTWTVPETLPSAHDYSIRIADAANPSKEDYSDSSFSITGPLQITVPNGGERWFIRNSYTIQWNPGAEGNDVGIYLFKDAEDTLRRLIDKTSNTGQWSWSIPDTISAGTDYKIYVQLYTDSSIVDQSDAFFEIAFEPLPPPANLTASDGTHTDKISLTWDSVNGAGYYKVYRNTTLNSATAAAITGWQSGTAYEDTSATAGQTYYYWVKAAENFSGDGESGFSDSDSGYAQGCTYTISPQSQSFADSGGSGSVSVTAGSGCQWTAVGDASWISITSGSSGIGNGTVGYSVSANTGTSSRSGTLTVAGKTFTVTQDGITCSYSISPTGNTFVSSGGTGSISVTAQTGCGWNATSSATWISITSGSSGSGNGTVGYSVSANAGTSSRSGTLTVAGKTFTVTQDGITCSYSISPTGNSFFSSGGTGSISVTAQTGCGWNATSSATWISITSGISGSGNGTVGYSVSANTGTSSRSGTLTVAGKTFTVAQDRSETFTNSIGMTFRRIPAGTFMMGSPEDEPARLSNETLHQVTLTQDYYMMTTEVTQAQWKAVMESNPSHFSACGGECPVETVSWDDVQGFITALNAADGRKYRLPTEAEWEYAVRAGTTTAFYNGMITYTSCSPLDPNLDQIGWYCGNRDVDGSSTTHPVGQKQPNAWGLYDMSGNVGEWCQDWYGAYSTDAVTDPAGPSAGSYRVVRGGSSYAWLCRSAYRSYNNPTLRRDFVGFRLVILPTSSPVGSGVIEIPEDD